jgi:two-component system, response regulator
MSDKYVLLVEDNPDDVALTQVAFNKCQIPEKLMVTIDGEEALDFLFSQGGYVNRDHGQNPAAILLDLKLPYISGLEVLKQIRADSRTSLIPVIILSSSISDKDVQESYALGASKYFRKPVDFDQFMEIIQQVKSAWLDRDAEGYIK